MPVLPTRQHQRFQSTPSVGRATCVEHGNIGKLPISIHALRGEGDRVYDAGIYPVFQDFNPRPPWGGRPSFTFPLAELIKFQSTPSVGRATACSRLRAQTAFHFNPRPPWGGRRQYAGFRKKCSRFQSTPSVGRATFGICSAGNRRDISIHALRGEGDLESCQRLLSNTPFQSTPSVGRATTFNAHATVTMTFQSTPSVGRATINSAINPSVPYISIHALRGEGDYFRVAEIGLTRIFQSTPSVGRATYQPNNNILNYQHFNPRPPWGGRLQKYTNMQCYACT